MREGGSDGGSDSPIGLKVSRALPDLEVEHGDVPWLLVRRSTTRRTAAHLAPLMYWHWLLATGIGPGTVLWAVRGGGGGVVYNTGIVDLLPPATRRLHNLPM